jgi:transcriptional regulator with XRE-family HTH domain
MTRGSSKSAGRSHRALGRAIRAARERKGYSQESFSLRIGMDRSFYSSVERGEGAARLQTLLTIAAGLESSVGELCTRAKI